MQVNGTRRPTWLVFVAFLYILLLGASPQERGQSSLEADFRQAMVQSGEAYLKTRDRLLGQGKTAESFLRKKAKETKAWKERLVAEIVLARLLSPKKFSGYQEVFEGYARNPRFIFALQSPGYTQWKEGRDLISSAEFSEPDSALFLLELWKKELYRPLEWMAGDGKTITIGVKEQFLLTLWLLASSRDSRAVAPLMAYVAESRSAPSIVAFTLAEIGDPRSSDAMLKMYRETEDEWSLCEIALALGKLRSKKAIPALVGHLKKRWMRKDANCAEEALKKMGGREVLASAFQLLKDPNENIRDYGLRILAESGDESVLPELEQLKRQNPHLTDPVERLIRHIRKKGSRPR